MQNTFRKKVIPSEKSSCKPEKSGYRQSNCFDHARLRRSRPMLNWQDLDRMFDDDLRRQDVLYVNFACSAGVPGISPIDEGECETKLRTIVAAVEGWTAERLFLFETEPERFDHCWDRYRMAC